MSKKTKEQRARLVKWDKRFMDMAETISVWSEGPIPPVGALITDRSLRIISRGFTQLPFRMKATDEMKKDAKMYSRYASPAEYNAITSARRSVTGCQMYVYPFIPAPSVAILIAQAGITRVVTHLLPQTDAWGPQTLSEDIFKRNRVDLVIREMGKKS